MTRLPSSKGHLLNNRPKCKHKIRHLPCAEKGVCIKTCPQIRRLYLLRLDGFVPPACSHAREAHQCRALVHGRVVHFATAEDSRSVFSLAKDGSRIAPKVLTIGHTTPAVGVLLLSSTVTSGSATAGNHLDKGVNTENAAPLFEHAPLVSTSVAAGGRGGCRGRCEGWIQRCAGRGKRRSRLANVNARHVFKRRHGPGHLNELGEHQHGHPYQLQADPDRQE